MKIAPWLLPAIGLLAGTAQAEGPSPIPGLNPDQLQSIRVIGRSVLAAKKAQADDPALAGLRQGVEELRSLAKDELSLSAMSETRMNTASTTPIPPSGPAATLSPAKPPVIAYPSERAPVDLGKHNLPEAAVPATQQSSVASVPSVPTEPDNRQVRARARLAAVAERRTRIQAGLTMNSEAQDARLAQQAATRLEGLEQELDAALAEAPQARRQKLADLMQRLEPRHLGELLRAAPDQEPQPTLSTRVRHIDPVEPESTSPAAPPAAEPKKLKVKKPNAKNKRR